jgi:hypothetical protein
MHRSIAARIAAAAAQFSRESPREKPSVAFLITLSGATRDERFSQSTTTDDRHRLHSFSLIDA